MEHAGSVGSPFRAGHGAMVPRGTGTHSASAGGTSGAAPAVSTRQRTGPRLGTGRPQEDRHAFDQPSRRRPDRRTPPGRGDCGPRSSLRRAHRSQRGRQPAPDDDVRRIPRRGGALHHLVRVRRWRWRLRQSHATPRGTDECREGRRLDAPAAAPRDRSRSRTASAVRPRLGRRGADRAEVLMEVTIDALDITVLRGGADEVGVWAKDHGFRLPPDAPEVLEFYAARSQIFLAAAFDGEAAAARGQNVGDGTPVHITIPTENPWVPLRILALGKGGDRSRRGRRVPPQRPEARDAARAGRLQRDVARLQPARFRVAPGRPSVRPRHGMGARSTHGCPRSRSMARPPSSGTTWRSTPPVPERRPASPPDSTCRAPTTRPGPAMLRTLGTMMFVIGSLGALIVLVTRRPSGSGMHPA